MEYPLSDFLLTTDQKSPCKREEKHCKSQTSITKHYLPDSSAMHTHTAVMTECMISAQYQASSWEGIIGFLQVYHVSEATYASLASSTTMYIEGATEWILWVCFSK